MTDHPETTIGNMTLAGLAAAITDAREVALLALDCGRTDPVADEVLNECMHEIWVRLGHGEDGKA